MDGNLPINVKAMGLKGEIDMVDKGKLSVEKGDYTTPYKHFSNSMIGLKAHDVSQTIRNEAFQKDVIKPITEKRDEFRAKTKVTKMQGKLHKEYIDNANDDTDKSKRLSESDRYWDSKGYGVKKKKR